MYKDKYKNNYIAVLRAIEDALIYFTWGDLTRLYISKDNRLESIELQDIKDILKSLSEESVLQVREDISLSDYLIDDSAWATTNPDYLGGKRRILKNYFLLEVSKIAFKRLLRRYGPQFQLLSLIPVGRKYKNQKVIAQLLIKKGKVDNHEIATKIRIKDNHSIIKISKKDYLRNKERIPFYNEKIENCLKTLRDIFRPYGYKIKFNQRYTELINIQAENSLS